MMKHRYTLYPLRTLTSEDAGWFVLKKNKEPSLSTKTDMTLLQI